MERLPVGLRIFFFAATDLFNVAAANHAARQPSPGSVSLTLSPHFPLAFVLFALTPNVWPFAVLNAAGRGRNLRKLLQANTWADVERVDGWQLRAYGWRATPAVTARRREDPSRRRAAAPRDLGVVGPVATLADEWAPDGRDERHRQEFSLRGVKAVLPAAEVREPAARAG